jgi:hypothetical protein
MFFTDRQYKSVSVLRVTHVPAINITLCCQSLSEPVDVALFSTTIGDTKVTYLLVTDRREACIWVLNVTGVVNPPRGGPRADAEEDGVSGTHTSFKKPATGPSS